MPCWTTGPWPRSTQTKTSPVNPARFIVNTSNWWIGQHVLISPKAVREVDWPDHSIRLDLARDQVKASPSWNPADEVTGEFEKEAQGHYHWPGYGRPG